MYYFYLYFVQLKKQYVQLSFNCITINVSFLQEQSLDDQLWNLALTAGPGDQIEAATYLESLEPEKAVLLYHKGGALHKALDLAFK